MRLTIQCGIVKLTRRKRELLDREYNNLQEFLKVNRQVALYSANKQQALRYYKKTKKQKEYPLSLRNDLINLKKSKSFWFLKVPVCGVYGGIRVPIKMHRNLPISKSRFCESKIVRRGNG
nr:hypothetical protein [Candidatus Njordarchaeum guaymaensis]